MSEDSILDENLNIQELLSTIKYLNNYGPAHDNILNEIIKHLSKSYLMVLLDFYNFSWNQGIFPDQWKLSSVIPVYKKDKDKNMISNHRLVTNRLY